MSVRACGFASWVMQSSRYAPNPLLVSEWKRRAQKASVNRVTAINEKNVVVVPTNTKDVAINEGAEKIAAELYGWWWKMVSSIEGPYGTRQLPAPYSISVHGAAGKRTGALPSGRLAGHPLADGSVSPCQGVDVKGPTAVINSAGKIDQVRPEGHDDTRNYLPTMAVRAFRGLDEISGHGKCHSPPVHL